MPKTVLILLITAIVAACALGVYSVYTGGLPAAAAPQPAETPAPEPTPTSTPMPTPTSKPTPTPEPTPTPFEVLAPTTRMSFAELVGDNGIYDAPTGWPPADTYKLLVDIKHQVVIAYVKDELGEFTVPVRYMVCTSGGNGNYTPTGVFEAGDHRVRFGLFHSAGVYGQYWTQIYGNFYFHTLLYGERDASTYTRSSYKLLGMRGSHGCVRLLVPDARWIYYNIAPGTEIEIRRGSSEDLETAAIKEQLVRAELPEERPNLKPGEIPDTDNWSIDDLKIYWTTPEPTIEPTPTIDPTP